MSIYQKVHERALERRKAQQAAQRKAVVPTVTCPHCGTVYPINLSMKRSMQSGVEMFTAKCENPECQRSFTARLVTDVAPRDKL
jgi:ssDNA-binding Zn-finger/Zn-ribbon topoisomerase 1